MSILDYSAYIFDLDGCVYFEDVPAPGMPELTSLLRRRGRRILFLSNNSTHSPEQIRDKLAGMGIQASVEEVYLASTLTGRHILEQYGPSRICAAGSRALARELARHGHTLVDLESDQPCRILVMGRDLCFTAHRLRRCVERIEQGAVFYATNIDTYQPTNQGGRLPETGALAAAVTAVTEYCPVSVGKPDTYAFERILEDQGIPAKDCLMIGDNPATDILGARRAGMDSCRLTLREGTDPADQGATYTFSSAFALCRAVFRAAGQSEAGLPGDRAPDQGADNRQEEW